MLAEYKFFAFLCRRNEQEGRQNTKRIRECLKSFIKRQLNPMFLHHVHHHHHASAS